MHAKGKQNQHFILGYFGTQHRVRLCPPVSYIRNMILLGSTTKTNATHKGACSGACPTLQLALGHSLGLSFRV